MVYLSSWQEFQDAAEAMYMKAPRKTRYTVKWKSTENILVLKITDNVTCLKYKTHSSIILNRFEALNYSLMLKMQNHKPKPTLIPADLPSRNTPTPVPGPGGPAQAASPGGAAAAAAAKKKKGKKKK